MSEAIIGGAIAAVIGALCYAGVGLLQELRRERNQQLTIVDSLIIETEENLAFCETTATSHMWWMTPFKVEAYQVYKSQISFLSEEVRIKLVSAKVCMEGLNIIIQAYQSKEAFKSNARKEIMPPLPELIKQLEFVLKELREWRAEHTRSLSSRIRFRLRNLISNVRKFVTVESRKDT